MSSNSIPDSGREYRHSTALLYASGVATIVFLAMGAFAVHATVNRPDCADRVEVAAILCVMSVLCSLAPAWLMLLCLRDRLFVSAETVRSSGIFRTAEVQLADVSRLVWNAPTRSRKESLVLHSATSSIEIRLYLFREQRTELVGFFREKLADRTNDGWERFDAFYSEPVDWDKELARSRREVRNVSIMGAIAVPLIFGSLIGLDYLDPRPRRYWIEYVLMGLLLLILSTVFGTLLWISHRAAKDSARKEREEKSAFRGGA